MKRLLLALIVAGAVVGIPVYAHHSFEAQYFEEQTLSIEGELVEFEYRSPHAWVHVMAKDENGQMQRFSAEWASPNRLSQQSVGKDTLKPGDRLVISGSPARNASERKLHLKQMERPANGWKWAGGRRGRR